MFGLVMAVGVLVDDPIVVVEYAERKLQEGVPKREAFILAARKMFVPVVSATFTTLSAFVVLLFWPGIIGKFMAEQVDMLAPLGDLPVSQHDDLVCINDGREPVGDDQRRAVGRDHVEGGLDVFLGL